MDKLIQGKKYRIFHVYDGKFKGTFVSDFTFIIDGKEQQFKEHHIHWELVK